MSLLDVTSSLEGALLDPVVSPMFAIPSAADPRSARRASLAGRLLGAVRSLRGLCSRVLLPPKSRRLRVSETVALGDKRFVSIVQVDGIDYLIGGGSANVSLLTQLGPTPVAPTFQQAVAQAWEQTESA